MQVKTKCQTVRHKGHTWVLFEIILLPEGSGNRQLAERVAKAFRKNEHLAKHIKRVTHTTSRVRAYFDPSFEFMADWASLVLEERERRKSRDTPGQLFLPGVGE